MKSWTLSGIDFSAGCCAATDVESAAIAANGNSQRVVRNDIRASIALRSTVFDTVLQGSTVSLSKFAELAKFGRGRPRPPGSRPIGGDVRQSVGGRKGRY